MKKIIVFFSVMVMACTVMAGPRCYRRGNSGVNLAADIIGLVGMGLDVLRPPVVVAPAAAPVYGPPAYAVPQVIPPTPVYTAPPIVVAPVTNVYPYPAAPAPMVYPSVPVAPVAPVAPVVYPTAPAVYPTPGYYRR